MFMPPWFVVVLGVGGRVACGKLYGLFIPLLLRIWYTFFFARYNREVSPKPLMRLLFPFLIHSYNVHCSFFCSCATFKRSVFKDIIPNHCLLPSFSRAWRVSAAYCISPVSQRWLRASFTIFGIAVYIALSSS